jgi:hypothetical protein
MSSDETHPEFPDRRRSRAKAPPLRQAQRPLPTTHYTPSPFLTTHYTQAPVSEATKTNYAAKLQAWADQKLQQYDEDAAFRAARDAKHTDRRGYLAFLDKQTKGKLAKETGSS